MANKTKYIPEFNQIIFELKITGKNITEICSILKIDKKTFYRWLKRYDNFKISYEKANNAKFKAKETLIDKALGFTRNIKELTPTGKLIKYDKYYPPDFQSIKYLLRNISGFDKELENKIKIDNKRLELEEKKLNTDTNTEGKVIIVEGENKYLEWKNKKNAGS